MASSSSSSYVLEKSTSKKNRKVKLLKQHYPEINIQVFYQRDFQNLVFKHGLQERPVEA